MTEDVPHFDQASSRLDHVGRRIVPQVVPFEIGYARMLHQRAETAAQPFVWPTGLGIEEQILRPFTGMSKVTKNRWTAQTITQSSPDNPKDHYKKGEQYLKWKRVFDAYEEFARAATLDSSNEKYRKKMIEVGKTASRLAESEAREVMNVSLKRAEWLLRRAIEYDDSNTSASQLLTLIRQNIANASEKAKQAQAALDSGEVGLAENIINSLTEYRESVPAISGLEQELLSAKHAVAALSLWERKEEDRAIEELSRAEGAQNSVFISRVSNKIRQEFSEYLLSTATTIKAQTLASILEKLQMVKKALVIYGGNVKALDLQRQISSALVEAILSQNLGSSGEAVSSNKARVYLETLRSAAPWITGDSKFDREKAREEETALPSFGIMLQCTSRGEFGIRCRQNLLFRIFQSSALSMLRGKRSGGCCAHS